MPYNATWIEPWMRPLKKTARRRRIPNQTANLRQKNDSKNASKNIITSPKNIFNRHPNTLEKVRSSTINSRRATRKRRLPSNDWTKRFSTPAKRKDKRPDVLRSKSKASSKPLTIRLGTSI